MGRGILLNQQDAPTFLQSSAPPFISGRRGFESPRAGEEDSSVNTRAEQARNDKSNPEIS